MRRLFACLLFASLACPASAHPHVWVTARSEIQYDAAGQMTGIRHDWTFDEGFSTYAVEGLEKKDGRLTKEAAESLAKINVESLVEFDYFTFGKSSGKPLVFTTPADYRVTEESGLITLHFTLPLKAPMPGKTVSLEMYDPTFYVDFSFAKAGAAVGEPVKLGGAPPGCTVSVRGSGSVDPTKAQGLSESFFNNLGAGPAFGSQFANKVLAVCP